MNRIQNSPFGLCIGLIYCVVIYSMVGCAGVSPTGPHPLDNKVVNAIGNNELGDKEIGNLIASADVVYLGEVHDNPWHHQIQREVIQKLLSAGANPAIGMEMFSNIQTSRLMTFVDGATSTSNSTADSDKRVRQLRKQLGWSSDRDDEWDRYFPLIVLARESGLPLFGIDLDIGVRRRITKVGIQGLSPVERRHIESTDFDNSAYRELMEQEFTRAHCGWSEPDLLDKLYQTWVARNDTMAIAISDMLSTRENRPIVVVVGKGHTKHSMGVYERVDALVPGVKQLNIGLIPTVDELSQIEDYLDLAKLDNSTSRPAHAVFWFTPAVDKIDPCIKFQEQLKLHSTTGSSE